MDRVTQQDEALETLLYKLEGWLKQQAEWPLLLLPDRHSRKRLEREIARRVSRIPTR